MHTESHRLDSSITEAELMTLIDALNRDESVHGILVQLPLPPHIDKAGILLAIDPAKDVDGFHPMNAGLLASDSDGNDHRRSEEHTSELQSLMRISYAVFCLK